jgi:hypothetical protein
MLRAPHNTCVLPAATQLTCCCTHRLHGAAACPLLRSQQHTLQRLLLCNEHPGAQQLRCAARIHQMQRQVRALREQSRRPGLHSAGRCNARDRVGQQRTSHKPLACALRRPLRRMQRLHYRGPLPAAGAGDIRRRRQALPAARCADGPAARGAAATPRALSRRERAGLGPSSRRASQSKLTAPGQPSTSPFDAFHRQIISGVPQEAPAQSGAGEGRRCSRPRWPTQRPGLSSRARARRPRPWPPPATPWRSGRCSSPPGPQTGPARPARGGIPASLHRKGSGAPVITAACCPALTPALYTARVPPGREAKRRGAGVAGARAHQHVRKVGRAGCGDALQLGQVAVAHALVLRARRQQRRLPPGPVRPPRRPRQRRPVLATRAPAVAPAGSRVTLQTGHHHARWRAVRRRRPPAISTNAWGCTGRPMATGPKPARARPAPPARRNNSNPNPMADFCLAGRAPPARPCRT